MTETEKGLRAIHKVLKQQRTVLVQIRNILGAAGEAAAEEAAGGEGEEDEEQGDAQGGDDGDDEGGPESHGERRAG